MAYERVHRCCVARGGARDAIDAAHFLRRRKFDTKSFAITFLTRFPSIRRLSLHILLEGVCVCVCVLDVRVENTVGDNDEGHTIVWQASQQDAHGMPSLRSILVPHSGVCLLFVAPLERLCLLLQKSQCSMCGYPDKRKRKFNWSVKSIRRRRTGTGRMQHLKKVHRRFRYVFVALHLREISCLRSNGFREGTVPKPKKGGVTQTLQAVAQK